MQWYIGDQDEKSQSNLETKQKVHPDIHNILVKPGIFIKKESLTFG